MERLSPIITESIRFEPIRDSGVHVRVARLDLIHPVISGNKLFKLHYFLEPLENIKNELIITAGGAYSNHLVATAYACSIRGIRCLGIVRGEKKEPLNSSLTDCMRYGMTLHFISRSKYDSLRDREGIAWLEKTFGPHLFIPEGGFHPLGAKGAALIPGLLKNVSFTHLSLAVGTATTLAGLAGSELTAKKKILGFPALKGLKDVPERFRQLNIDYDPSRINIINNYHFGGYAKKNNELTDFMNHFYSETGIPTDFVYTGKMMFGIMDMIRQRQFPKESEILCLHTGGLQGNRSLPPGTLDYRDGTHSNTE